MAADDESIQLELAIDWSAADEVEAQVATQFLVQVGMPAGGMPDGVILIVGHVNPPIVFGSKADRLRQAEGYGGQLPVQVHGRYVLSRARLEELRNALNELAEKYDELAEGDQS